MSVLLGHALLESNANRVHLRGILLFNHSSKISFVFINYPDISVHLTY